MALKMKTYFDSYYGLVDLISEQTMWRRWNKSHKNCDGNSDTVVDDEHQHIEHIFCKDHRQSPDAHWFILVR